MQTSLNSFLIFKDILSATEDEPEVLQTKASMGLSLWNTRFNTIL